MKTNATPLTSLPDDDDAIEALIREVLSDARWAPSWGNTQSTSAYVLSGDALARLKAGLLERALKEAPGEPDLEMPAPGSWPEPYRSRAGGFVQSLALAAHERGLGTCVMAMAVRHPELLHDLGRQARRVQANAVVDDDLDAVHPTLMPPVHRRQ